MLKPLTEPRVLSRIFKNHDIAYELVSNDSIWTDRAEISKELLAGRLRATPVDVIHLAVHGAHDGLVLKWSKHHLVGARVPINTLTSSDIRSIPELEGKLVVSGACSSARFAADFLSAGAKAVVAPLSDIPWIGLGPFFQSFYLCYRSLNNARVAVDRAIGDFPEYRSYRVFQQ